MGFWSWAGHELSGAWHGVEHGAQDLWAGATGGKSWEQEQQEQQAQNATKQGDAQRAALQAQSRGLHVGEYDPPSIQQQDNWQSLSQQQIFQSNQKLDQQAAEDAGRAWADIASKLRQMGPDYSNGLKQKIASGWEGEAAQAASNVGDPLAKWMGDSANAFQDTGIRIQEAASAAGQVKTAVGPPSNPSLAQQFGQALATGASPVAGITDQVQQMQQQQQEQKAAQETMARVLGTTYQQADSQVPAYKDVQGKPVAPPPPPPPSSGSPLPPPVGGGGGMGGGGGSAGHVSGVPNFGSSSGMPNAAIAAPDMGTPAGTQAAGAAAAPPMTGNLGAPTMAGGGAAGGAAGGGGAAGAGMMGGVGGMAGGGRAGGLSAGGRAGAAGASGSGAGGRGGSAGSGSGSSAGRSSSSSSSSPGARGGHGKGGEDDEHERPSWLEEQDDIWLNDMPRVAPPVFGE